MSTIEDKVRQIVVSTLKDELHDWRVEHGDARLENLRKRVEKLEQRVRFVLPETQKEVGEMDTHNPERIYVEPEEQAVSPEGRGWSDQDIGSWTGEPWTEYVQADLYAALLEIVREAATFPCRAPDPPCPEVYPDTPEHWCMTCRARVAPEKGAEG